MDLLARFTSAFIPDLLYLNKSTRHPLMITTHYQHSTGPSWSTLFSPIPLEDYRRVPPASPVQLSSRSHIGRANIKHYFFLGLFTHRQKVRVKKKKTQNFLSLCQVHLSSKVLLSTHCKCKQPLIFILLFRVL